MIFTTSSSVERDHQHWRQTVEVTQLKVRETAHKYDELVQRERELATTSAPRSVETHALHRVRDLRRRFEGVQGPLAMRTAEASASRTPLTGASRRFDVYGKALMYIDEQDAADCVADSDSDNNDNTAGGSVSASTTATVDEDEDADSDGLNHVPVADPDAAAVVAQPEVAAAAAWLWLAMHAFDWLLTLLLMRFLKMVWLVCILALHTSYIVLPLLEAVVLAIEQGFVACATAAVRELRAIQAIEHARVEATMPAPELKRDTNNVSSNQSDTEADTATDSEAEADKDTETESEHETELTLQLEFDAMIQISSSSADLPDVSGLALEPVTDAESTGDFSDTFETTLGLDIDAAPTSADLPDVPGLALEPVTDAESTADFSDMSEATLGLDMDPTPTRADLPAMSELTLELDIDVASTAPAATSAKQPKYQRPRRRINIHHGNPYGLDVNSKYLLYETASTAYERRRAIAAAQRAALGSASKSSWR